MKIEHDGDAEEKGEEKEESDWVFGPQEYLNHGRKE